VNVDAVSQVRAQQKMFREYISWIKKEDKYVW